MRTEEANCPKDKIDFPSLNSSRPNLVESAIPTNGDRFKGKDKKNKKPNDLK